MPIQIFVDSDSCPVKDEAMRVAGRYSLEITFVSNQGMRPINSPNVKQVVVSAKFDAADDWIFENINSGDIVITADIPLAARCLGKGAKALSNSGHVFTTQNIGATLSLRELNSHLRETGDIKGYNPTFSKKDRSQFLQSLDMLIQKNKK